MIPGPSLPHGLSLPSGRTLVMGILNVTPDSFSDGGKWTGREAALDHAEAMLAAGADLIDIGGESTRPGSRRVDVEEEWSRIGTVVTELASRGAVVSVDTLHADTARLAADAGAAIINDVSGGRFDPRMNEVVAGSGCAFVVQHWRGLPGTPEEDLAYDDVVADVLAETAEQVGSALNAGVDAERIIIDPGLGFSLSADDCWQIVASLGRLGALGYPVLVGASRKRFLAGRRGEDRDLATLDITREAVETGMWAVRVHDVAPNARLVRGAETNTQGGERA